METSGKSVTQIETLNYHLKWIVRTGFSLLFCLSFFFSTAFCSEELLFSPSLEQLHVAECPFSMYFSNKDTFKASTSYSRSIKLLFLFIHIVYTHTSSLSLLLSLFLPLQLIFPSLVHACQSGSPVSPCLPASLLHAMGAKRWWHKQKREKWATWFGGTSQKVTLRWRPPFDVRAQRTVT